MAILVSLGVIFGILVACDLIRSFLKTDSPGLGRKLIFDCLLAIELCGAALEYGVIFQYYGMAMWTVGLFVNCLYQGMRWRGLTPPIPYVHLLLWWEGKESFFEMVVRNLTVLLAGIASYYCIVVPIWNMEFSSYHMGRSLETQADICINPWSQIPISTAMISEFVGTFALGVISNAIAENPTLNNNDPIWTGLLMAFVVTVAVHGGLGFSGGLFNPMLASVLFARCKGTSIGEHILIYWIGSCLGAVASHVTYPKVKHLFYASKPEKSTVSKKDAVKAKKTN